MEVGKGLVEIRGRGSEWEKIKRRWGKSCQKRHMWKCQRTYNIKMNVKVLTKRVKRKGRLVEFSSLSPSIVDVVKDGNHLACYEIHVHVFWKIWDDKGSFGNP